MRWYVEHGQKKVKPKKRSTRAQNIDDDKTDGNEKRKQKDLRLRMFKLKETHYTFTLFLFVSGLFLGPKAELSTEE